MNTACDALNCSQLCHVTPVARCSCREGFVLVGDRDCQGNYTSMLMIATDRKHCVGLEAFKPTSPIACEWFWHDGSMWAAFLHWWYYSMIDMCWLTDIDECTIDRAVCHQTCINLPGSYTCTCLPGFVTTANGSCIGKNDHIYSKFSCRLYHRANTPCYNRVIMWNTAVNCYYELKRFVGSCYATDSRLPWVSMHGWNLYRPGGCVWRRETMPRLLRRARLS